MWKKLPKYIRHCLLFGSLSTCGRERKAREGKGCGREGRNEEKETPMTMYGEGKRRKGKGRSVGERGKRRKTRNQEGGGYPD